MNFIQRWKLKQLYKKALIRANKFHDLTYLINSNSFHWYQENCRCYLDEFPEVEEWDYLPLFDNTVIMNRFMEKK